MVRPYHGIAFSLFEFYMTLFFLMLFGSWPKIYFTSQKELSIVVVEFNHCPHLSTLKKKKKKLVSFVLRIIAHEWRLGPSDSSKRVKIFVNVTPLFSQHTDLSEDAFICSCLCDPMILSTLPFIVLLHFNICTFFFQPVSQNVKVDHNPAGGHWFAAGLSPNVSKFLSRFCICICLDVSGPDDHPCGHFLM